MRGSAIRYSVPSISIHVVISDNNVQQPLFHKSERSVLELHFEAPAGHASAGDSQQSRLRLARLNPLLFREVKLRLEARGQVASGGT
jgi:hypothetical protein